MARGSVVVLAVLSAAGLKVSCVVLAEVLVTALGRLPCYATLAACGNVREWDLCCLPNDGCSL